MARQPNFDLVRLCLATLVFVGHYDWVLSQTPVPMHAVKFLIGEGGQRCVQAFFVISGFLMFQSFSRSGNVLHFYEKRVRRILPGYAVVILASAVAGLWLTRHTWHDYAASPDLARYLGWNLVFLNFMHPTLPGVFDAQPIHVVNGPLWTLKIEVSFYLLFPAIFMIGRRIGFVVCFGGLYVLSVAYATEMLHLAQATGRPAWHLLATQLPGQLCYFMAGALVAAWRQARPGTNPYAAGGLLVLALAGTLSWGLQMLVPATLAAALLAFCLNGPKLPSLARYGDWSYGVYILHFPVLQTVRSTRWLEAVPVLRFCVVSGIVFGLACILWHVVESPALRHRARTAAAVRRVDVGYVPAAAPDIG